MSLEVLRKCLGAYLIFGSLTGIYVCWNSYLTSVNSPLVWSIFVFGALFFLIGAAGISLLRNSQYVILAMILQVLQFVGFSLGYKYVFSAGTSLKLGYYPQTTDLLFIIEPVNSEFAVGKRVQDEFFYVNIIPFVVILLLNQLLPTQQKTTQPDV